MGSVVGCVGGGDSGRASAASAPVVGGVVVVGTGSGPNPGGASSPRTESSLLCDPLLRGIFSQALSNAERFAAATTQVIWKSVPEEATGPSNRDQRLEGCYYPG